MHSQNVDDEYLNRQLALGKNTQISLSPVQKFCSAAWGRVVKQAGDALSSAWKEEIEKR